MLHSIIVRISRKGFCKLIMALGNRQSYESVTACNHIKFGKITNKVRAYIVVALANIASFLAPFVYRAWQLNGFYGSGWFYSWERAFNNGPNYIIRLGYLILTIGIETPVVYFLLKNYSESKKRFISSILITNVITTILVAIIERLVCKGEW